MKILYIGDFETGNGPSQVDKNLLKKNGVKKEQINKNFIGIFSMKKYNFLIISGVSFKGMLYLLVANILNIKNLYIMHGSLKLEEEFRKISLKRRIIEYIILNKSTKIICVSELYMRKVLMEYPNFFFKTSYINNGVEKNEIKNKLKKEKNLVTFGGGRDEKGVLEVCKALDSLKNKTNIMINKLIVLGEEGKNSDKIKKYEFVEWVGFVDKKRVNEILLSSKYYIQNSHLESFGLSVLEALNNGCKILLSNNMPIARIIGLDDKYICKSRNILDIQNKIINLMNGIQIVDITKIKMWEEVSEEYIKEINKIKGDI